MSKRYRLVIPEMISRNHATLASKLSNHTEVGEDFRWLSIHAHIEFKDIPKDWLQEIKEQTDCNDAFDEILKAFIDNNQENNARYWFESGWEKCAENERKKHEPKQSLDELVNIFCKNNEWDDELLLVFRKGIQACEKNRGYND